MKKCIKSFMKEKSECLIDVAIWVVVMEKLAAFRLRRRRREITASFLDNCTFPLRNIDSAISCGLKSHCRRRLSFLNAFERAILGISVLHKCNFCRFVTEASRYQCIFLSIWDVEKCCQFPDWCLLRKRSLRNRLRMTKHRDCKTLRRLLPSGLQPDGEKLEHRGWRCNQSNDSWTSDRNWAEM